jgi:threonine/homoserine/homoserine lactone efflux protein
MDLWLFASLVFGVVLLPGLDMGFVLASALVGGRRAGLAAVAGIVFGGFCHVAAAVSGLALLLRASPAAYQGLLVAGAAYLAWVGVAVFRGGGGLVAAEGAVASPWLTLRRGMATCLLNPKAYLFMLAVFPRFLFAGAAGAGPLWVRAAALGAIIAAIQVLVYGAVALAADRARGWAGPRAGVLLARPVGGVLVGAAVATAVSAWW